MSVDMVHRAQDAQNVVPPLHVRFLRVYEDFHNLADTESAPSKFMEIIAHAKHIIANGARHDVSVVLAAMRRKATAQLLLNQPKRALSTATQIIRLQFDWPYGHLMKADALVGLGNLAAAANAYQLAEQFMPPHDPTDDIGRPEVLDQCQALADGMAALSCLTLTAAHTSEITALASWPQDTRTTPPPSGRPRSKHNMSAENLQDSVNSAVINALEAISRDGYVSHVPLQMHSQHAGENSPDSPMWGVLNSGSTVPLSDHQASPKRDASDPSKHGAKPGLPNTLDQLLADEMRRKASTTATPAKPNPDGAVPTSRDDGSPASLLTLLDTGASSVTDTNGVLRYETTASEGSEFKTQGTNLHLSMNTSPSPSVPANALDSGPDGEEAPRSNAGTAADHSHAWITHLRRINSSHQSYHHSTLSSGAGEERHNSTLGSTASIATMEGQQQFVVTGDVSGGLRLWDVTHLDCANELQGHSAAITSLVFAKHRRKGCLLLASGDADGLVMVWALDQDGALLESNEFHGHSGPVKGSRFVSKGRRLVTVSADATVCVWDLARGEMHARLEGHAQPISVMDSMSIKSATALVTASEDGQWRLWDLDMKRYVLSGQAQGRCTHAHFTPRLNGLEPPRPLLATCHWHEDQREATIHFWDVFDTSKDSTVVSPQHSYAGVARGMVTGIDFSRDHSGNPLMAVASGDGSLLIYDLHARSVLSHLTEVHVDADGNVVPLYGLLYSMDGRLLMTCGDDGSVKVWSVADMEVLLTFLGHSSAVTQMAKTGGPFAMLATASQCGQLALWDLRLAHQLATSIQANLGTK